MLHFNSSPCRQACSQVKVHIDACAAQGGRAWRTKFYMIWGPNSVADRFFLDRPVCCSVGW